MAKALHRSTGIVLLLTIISIILYNRTSQGLFLTLAITFGTTAYHFLMRLLVGWLFENIMHNHADYTRKWYQLRPWERKFYAFCKVKKWKNKMPTYPTTRNVSRRIDIPGKKSPRRCASPNWDMRRSQC